MGPIYGGRCEKFFAAAFWDRDERKSGQGIFASCSGLFRSRWRKNCSVMDDGQRVKKFCDSSWHESAHGITTALKKLGVKTRCFEDARRNITRKIIRGLKNFPLRKKDSCRY
jgi:hypothetical protein